MVSALLLLLVPACVTVYRMEFCVRVQVTRVGPDVYDALVEVS